MWKVVKPFVKRIVPFLFVAAILGGAWYGFLAITKPPPIETTPALIMVWVSAFILLFSLFPNILDKIKRIKVKDFELELQETVARETSKDFFSILDLDEHIFSTKGNFRNLNVIIEQVAKVPDKPVLLVVNLRDDHYISIPMLFIYLFFLDIVVASVTVLFVSSIQHIRTLSDIRRDFIIGAMLGKRVMRVLLEKFPQLSRIFNLRIFNDNTIFEEFFHSGRFSGDKFENFFNHMSELMNDLGIDWSDHLTISDVENWFRSNLSRRTIEVSVSIEDIRKIRQSISREDEFVLVLSDNRLNSVVSVCSLTRDIARKVLEDY